MQISKYNIVQSLNQNSKLSEKNKNTTGKSSFGNSLNEALKEVNKLQTEADESINSTVSGKSADIHQTIIAMEKADISFKLMMQIRNKAIEAYQEMMRMQV